MNRFKVGLLLILAFLLSLIGLKRLHDPVHAAAGKRADTGCAARPEHAIEFVTGLREIKDGIAA
jgi:hypothetical protein